MLPYLHIFGFSVPTFGLMIWAGTMVAAWLMDRAFRREKLTQDAILVVIITLAAGVIGAKIWHVLDTPEDFRTMGIKVLWDSAGFAWFGGLTFGITALLIQGWVTKIGTIRILDLSAPSAAIGYGIGRIGCLLSGDGCYGIATTLPWGMSFPSPALVPTWERVHPTPLYEFLVAILICIYLLWRQRKGFATGAIVGQYLILSGIARFLVEFIRRNPHVLWGLSNAQLASIGSVLLGLLLILSARGSAPQPAATPEKPAQTAS